MKSFKELKVWQKGVQMVMNTYLVTKGFPNDEAFGLKLQLRRCAVSIPSNIAEGYGRQHTSEYIRFLHIARGSLNELVTQIDIAQRLGYVKDATVNMNECDEIGRMLNGLISRLSSCQRK